MDPATASDTEIFLRIIDHSVYGQLLRRSPRTYGTRGAARTIQGIWKDIRHIDAVIRTAREEMARLKSFMP